MSPFRPKTVRSGDKDDFSGLLASQLGRSLTPALGDLVRMAYAVCATDARVLRGRDWERCLSLQAEVSDVAFWGREEVRQALTAMLEFSTGDKWMVNFTQRRNESARNGNTYMPSLFPETRTVALVSEGLDSLCGVLWFHHTTDAGELVALNAPTQRVRGGRFERVLHSLPSEIRSRVTPVRLRLEKLAPDKVRDRWQRGKSFLYLALALATSHAADADRILIFENGDEAFDFPLQEGIFGTRIPHLMHPIGVARMQELADILLPNAPRFEMPFLFMSKSEMAFSVLPILTVDMAGQTVSCLHYSGHTGCVPCGNCIECVRRSEALCAVGIEDTKRGILSSRLGAKSSSSKERSDGAVRALGFARLREAWAKCTSPAERWNRLLTLSGLEWAEKEYVLHACALISGTSAEDVPEQIVRLYESLINAL